MTQHSFRLHALEPTRQEQKVPPYRGTAHKHALPQTHEHKQNAKN